MTQLKERVLRLSTSEEFAASLKANYLRSLGIRKPPKYESGVSVSAVPPRQITRNGVLILGAYPTAEFDRANGRIVPVNNIAEPFDAQTASGKELDEFYLNKLCLTREQCWITNLLKVFLFKPGHIGSGTPLAASLSRSRFEELASSQANIEWLVAELRIASPKVVITLGREVAGIIRGVQGDAKRNKLLGGTIQEHALSGKTCSWVHLPHPGIVMRKGSERNKWPRRHSAFCAKLHGPISDILRYKPQI